MILVVLANTMAMNARERLGEYAALKTMGFKPRHLAGLILGESLHPGPGGRPAGPGPDVSGGGDVSGFPGPVFRSLPRHRARPWPWAWGSPLGVGLLAACFPAWQAARVSIAAALRRVG